jgi:hypothetical protein
MILMIRSCYSNTPEPDQDARKGWPRPRRGIRTFIRDYQQREIVFGHHGEHSSRTAVDGKLANTARASPATSAPLSQVADANQDWEICDILAKNAVDGELHYLVDWRPTLVPEHALGNAKEPVDEFEARFRTQYRQRGEKRRGRLHPSKAGKQASRQLREIAQQARRNRRKGEVDLGSRYEIDRRQRTILGYSDVCIGFIISKS